MPRKGETAYFDPAKPQHVQAVSKGISQHNNAIKLAIHPDEPFYGRWGTYVTYDLGNGEEGGYNAVYKDEPDLQSQIKNFINKFRRGIHETKADLTKKINEYKQNDAAEFLIDELQERLDKISIKPYFAFKHTVTAIFRSEADYEAGKPPMAPPYDTVRIQAFETVEEIKKLQDEEPIHQTRIAPIKQNWVRI